LVLVTLSDGTPESGDPPRKHRSPSKRRRSQERKTRFNVNRFVNAQLRGEHAAAYGPGADSPPVVELANTNIGPAPEVTTTARDARGHELVVLVTAQFNMRVVADLDGSVSPRDRLGAVRVASPEELRPPANDVQGYLARTAARRTTPPPFYTFRCSLCPFEHRVSRARMAAGAERIFTEGSPVVTIGPGFGT
jgi:hypothetical protein